MRSRVHAGLRPISEYLKELSPLSPNGFGGLGTGFGDTQTECSCGFEGDLTICPQCPQEKKCHPEADEDFGDDER